MESLRGSWQASHLLNSQNGLKDSSEFDPKGASKIGNQVDELADASSGAGELARILGNRIL